MTVITVPSSQPTSSHAGMIAGLMPAQQLLNAGREDQAHVLCTQACKEAGALANRTLIINYYYLYLYYTNIYKGRF